MLAAKAPHSDLLLPAAAGIALAVLAAAGFIATQRGAGSLFRALAARVGGERFGPATRRVDRVQAALEAIYAAPGRVLAGLRAAPAETWLGTAIGTWLAYRLMAMPIDLPTAIAIEALLHVALAIGFLVPGTVGVQEAAFAGIGGIFGLPAEASLAVSLLSRARDLVLGVPILLAWQAIEARRLAAAREVKAALEAPPRPGYGMLPSAGVVQWQNGSLPSCSRGFDSPRPLRLHRSDPVTALTSARASAADCERCRLYVRATQTVFGEGPESAELCWWASSRGTRRTRRPAVRGSGGQGAGRGTRRSRDRPQPGLRHECRQALQVRAARQAAHPPEAGSSEIVACRFWLDIELAEVQPALTVPLGATAARAVLGRTVTIGRERGRPIALLGQAQALVTVHPSYLLRLPDEAAKRREYAAFVQDLRQAARLAA